MEAVVSPNFWRGKRVFLTGHTGFKGSWLTTWLHRLGAVVSGYALDPPTTPAMFDQIGGAQMCADNRGDIRDEPRMTKVMRDFGPEVLIHLAAQPIVLAARELAIETIDINVRGTACVLNAARECRTLKSVVSVTTDKVYRNVEWAWPYRESDHLGGHEPYGASKACAEIVTEAWAHCFLKPAGIAVGAARAGNVIGGGDWAPARLVPDLIRALASKEPLVLRNPESIRPWQHVLEPLAGYLIYAQAMYEGRAGLPPGLNFGPRYEDAQPVRVVIDLAQRTLGNALTVKIDRPPVIVESMLLRLDSSLAVATLGWKPQWELEKAVGMTLEWYMRAAAGENPRTLCEQQIDAYQKSLAGAK